MSEQATQAQQYNFETEAKELLHLMVHSLYSNAEIFLRELVSNSSDALDKLRFLALSNNALYENDSALAIHIDFDEKLKLITVTDNGIGMSKEEIITNLGTIAKSGTREFIKDKLTGDSAKDSQLIGQFGVGFYSGFIVADKITVNSRKAGLDANEGVCWESTGDGTYTLETINKTARGTQVILHLKEDMDEFLSGTRLRSIIHTYSDHISFPVIMKKEPEPKIESKESEDEIVIEEDETVNRATALWTRNKSDISDTEYNEFYKHISHDFDDALAWAHNRVEGKTEFTSLLYIPKRAPFDLWNRERRYGVKLYVKRVFIIDDAEQFMPTYLRFVRGVIDTADLPLNISREILQTNKVVDAIKSACTKRVLKLLSRMATEDAEQYQSFWEQFGEVLKEGPAEDFSNKETIASLLRFATTREKDKKQTVSLDDYLGRMVKDQDKIYYATGENYNAAKSSPHLEIFEKQGVEVLLLSDRVDEWLTSHLTEYKGKTLQSVAKGELDLPELDNDPKKDTSKAEKHYEEMLTRLKKILSDKVKDVRMTYRLTSSPSCIVADEGDVGFQMQRILKAAGQEYPGSQPILELNPYHMVVKRLKVEKDDTRFADWGYLLLDQAILADGGQLEDPAKFVKRLNQLFIEVGTKS